MDSTLAISGARIAKVSALAGVPPDVALAQRGDAVAFERVYRTHVARVYALCVRMSGSEDRADELTQEIFIKTWANITTFRGDAAFSTWLHRLAVNHILFSFRTDKRRERRVATVDDPQTFDRASISRSPDEGIDLDKAIATLPDGARFVLVLHDVQGYTHDEIARTLGVTAGTSKAQLHRARRLLRRVLDEVLS